MHRPIPVHYLRGIFQPSLFNNIAKYRVPVLDHALVARTYVVRLLPNKVKRDSSVEAMKEKTNLKQLTEDFFQYCFERLKIRMERYRYRLGLCIEPD